MVNIIIFFTIGIISFIVGFLLGKIISSSKNDSLISDLKEQKLRLEEKNKYNEDNKATIEALKDTLQKEFQNIANKALIDNQNMLSEANKKSVAELVKNSQDNLEKELEKLKQNITTFNKDSSVGISTLKEQIEKLEANNFKVLDETKALTNALTVNQRTKGAYGEALLESIFEMCGFKNHWQYLSQEYLKIESDSETKNLRPDYIINLPNKRHIIIDSKATLTSYIEYANEEDEANKTNCEKKFKDAIKKRIKELSDKKYHTAGALDSPDFTLMYIPIESSLGMIYADSELIEQAMKQNIVIVGTASIICTIRIINHIWHQQEQNDNAKEIATVGASLYDKFAALCDNLINISKDFDKVTKNFKTALGRFDRGDDSLFKSVEKLKELGVRPTKQINADFALSIEKEKENED